MTEPSPTASSPAAPTATATAAANTVANANNAPTAPTAAPARPYRVYREDFPVGQRREFCAMPVTREAVLAFASQFDRQPFNLDDDAAASLFGRLSASG